MPIVDIKGIGKASFPDGMSADDIRSFLRNKYSQRAMSGDSDILQPMPDSATPYEPTLTDKFGQGIANKLFDSGVISNRYGAQEIGRNMASLGDFLPVIGDATAGDEFGRAVARGDGVGMALGALGVIPVAGDLAKKAVNVAKKNYDIAFKPLQAEYRLATADRKAEILKEAKILRQPLDYANSQLLRSTQEATPKKAAKQAVKEPDKTFKGKVFHQTSENFDDFDLNKGADGTVWFTGDKKNFSDPASSASAASGKGRVLERDVELKKVAGFKELDQFSIGELKQQGYDGAVLDGDIQVFDAKAIKPVKNQDLPMGDEVVSTKALSERILEDKGVKSLSLSEGKNGDLTLNKIIIDKGKQGSGIGKSAMKKIISHANDNGSIIKLDIGQKGDFAGEVTSPAKLKKFYKGLGFVENKGKNKDYEIAQEMYKLPTQQ